MQTVVWKPIHPENTRMWELMQDLAKTQGCVLETYEQFHAWSVSNPALFWSNLATYFQVRFTTPATSILNSYTHLLDARWFEGATFNFAEQLLRRRDEHPAIISINEAGERVILSYKTLFHEVAQCAQGLKKLGIGIGDRVVAMMPNTHYTLIAMLATTSLGAIWSSCSPDFGAQALIDRFEQLNPSVLLASDGYYYQGKPYQTKNKILAMAQAIPSLKQLIISPVLGDREVFDIEKTMSWDDFIQPATEIPFVSLPFNHPLYILFSSGTTGKPKCIVHGAGGTLLQHLKELGLHTDIREHDNLCFYTTCGWMMWNWMVSILALGSTLTLYEGCPVYPNANRLFQLIEHEGITVLGTSARFISVLEKEGICPRKEYSLKLLRTILSTGSPLLPHHYDFVYQQIKPDLQLSSISGGTDIISCFALGNPILPVYRGELQCIGLGMAVNVFNELGQSVIGEQGELVCTQPFPSMPLYFWNDPNKTLYYRSYFERFKTVWAHGDFAELTPHHGLIIYGRSDAILNPGGVRIGTAEIYRQVEKITEVVDSVVIGQNWRDDTRIVLFVKLKDGLNLDNRLMSTIRQTIRENTSPRHVPAKILQVTDVPRTINGKLVEVAVRQLVHGLRINNLDSIINPEVLKEFRERQELMVD